MFEIAEIQDAHRLLAPLLGTKWAPILFAVALIAAGQSSTVTGTLAGQIIMEGYLNLRIQPWVRRILTRLIAIVPAVLAIYFFGEDVTGRLLILSQVVLSLQLGFAIIPLIHFVSDKHKMKGFHIGLSMKLSAWAIALVIVSLNAKLVYNEIADWISHAENPTALWLTVVPLSGAFALLLLYITLKPFLVQSKSDIYNHSPHNLKLKPVHSTVYARKNIAVAVDFSAADEGALNNAFALGGDEAQYTLIHVVETIGAMFYGDAIEDHETSMDEKLLQEYKDMLVLKGFHVTTKLAFGSPAKSIPKIVNGGGFDLLVMGTHGHTGFKDMAFGTTVNKVRHRIKIPLFIVKH